MATIRKIRVLVVDDSALMRQLLSAVLQQDPAIEVVGTAADPFLAREKIRRLHPDVLTLDVEMPGMDGLAFLELLMRLRPMPVVMVSSHTDHGAQATLRALDLGAVDFVAKPRNGPRRSVAPFEAELRAKVREAAGARVRPPASRSPALVPLSPGDAEHGVIAIGASAGGTQAIHEIVAALPAETPGIAVVQHMPAGFTALFAAHLDSRSRMTVREAHDGDRLCRGTVLIAPGGMQMELARHPGGFAVRVHRGAPVNHHRPSVDVLFESVAQSAGADALGLLLTGMGADGARGLLALKRAGAHTIAQDEASSTIFGMPAQAIQLDAAREVLGLDQMAARIARWASAKSRVETCS
jgi:two-component system chemotaxis response regulator CheB